MNEFASACVIVRDRALGSANVEGLDAAWLAYVRDDGRPAEAARMTPCVARLVSSELHPPAEDTPVGRFSRRLPPLGRLVPDRGEHEPDVRRLVMVALAYGYFAMIDAEAIAALAEPPLASNVASRSAEQVWPDWVANMSSGAPLRGVVGRKEINRVKNICGENFYQGLRELELVGRRRRNFPFIGRFYAQAGMLLRVVQRDTFVPAPESEVQESADRWPFEDMPTA